MPWSMQRSGSMPALAQAQVAGVQLLEARVLEGAVVQPGAGVLVGVVDEARKGEQRDAVVGVVVGQPRADGVLEEDLGADERWRTSRSSPAGAWS